MAEQRRLLARGLGAGAVALAAAAAGLAAAASAAETPEVVVAPALVIEMDVPGVGDHIEILSFSFEVTQGGTSGGGASVHDLVVAKHLDSSSPKLLLACAMGGPLAEIHIRVCGAGGCTQQYLEYELEDAIISSYQIGGGSSGDTVPTESISMNFAKISLHYVEQDARVALAKKGRWWQVDGPR